ncbi:hypothetical protein METBIDRAFT_77000 [Metschnikowia bicuspidata var. bicuspidata NRRL YB-4993]|uniref:L-lactate dehydrogenase (cytochrome) n=1 Tax=Metschnikowia bicuspidata var. bicuspidata NRRL YB-4993 TaxID=869754 RepID=A0A1A0HJF5_9ASCO|nr:hypothetical protein METBIDRAFT_77000 [Metschnikowia bicuspidata var. bicuspidata NRRL YB-4993]OBA24145.1 hypothetical protein METBIDRAFT_77000 [Metschnikowia bicuspidata var. bicuspidata NRRL YB-4993]
MGVDERPRQPKDPGERGDNIELESPGNGVTVEELKKHTNSEVGVWVALNGKVYDLTGFMAVHPGGKKIIEKYAGKNASSIFNKFHGPDFIAKYLSAEECLGPLIGHLEEADDVTETGDDHQRQMYKENLPPLSEIFTLTDFEYIAKKVCSPSAWYYYSLGAQDEITLRENHNAFSRIFFRPRVLIDVPLVDLSTTMLGTPTGVPFYVSAAAQAKLGHPDGELSIARGCASANVIQMISHYSSYSAENIVKEATQGQSHWYQLYVTGKDAARHTIEQVQNLGVKALFVTVDTPELGRREKDMKLRARLERRISAGLSTDEKRTAAGSSSGNIDENHTAKNSGDSAGNGHEDLKSSVVYGRDLLVTWKDIKEFQQWSDLPLAVKGVQCVEDIVLAAENGVDAVVLSNHGGRQLDYSRAPVEVLADVMPVLRQKGLQDKIEIYVDGGVRRGGDVIKCLALGAKGVGLGRVFLYANACYGEAGVHKAIELLKEEMRIDMRLLGVSSVRELGPQHLDLRNLHARLAPCDHLYYGNYEPLSPPQFTHEE